MELSVLKQSILDAPTGTGRANGCRLGAVPSHPFSIYKTGLAYNEKHYLPPGHITLPAGALVECGTTRGRCGSQSVIQLHQQCFYTGGSSIMTLHQEINHGGALASR